MVFSGSLKTLAALPTMTRAGILAATLAATLALPARAADKANGPRKPASQSGPFSYACESAKGKGHLIYRGEMIEWESENKVGTHVLNPNGAECVEKSLSGKVQNYVIWGVKSQTLVLVIDNEVTTGAASVVARQILDKKGTCTGKIEFRCSREASVPAAAPGETVTNED